MSGRGTPIDRRAALLTVVALAIARRQDSARAQPLDEVAVDYIGRRRCIWRRGRRICWYTHW